MNELSRVATPPRLDADRLALLAQIERKLLWLSSWMIHHANHVRPNRDGLKVGGHQASCASIVSVMTALYFDVLRPQDRVAVKPHAGPVFHAINYLFGRQTREKLATLRAFGGIQSYPSRVKDGPEVDFSTGSVGLGVALTSFASLIADYTRLHRLGPELPRGRSIALAGDAELDEGNIYEALLEGWKHDVRNVWWIVDYNRQSLDSVVPDRLFGRIEGLFRDMGWNVVTMKYGRQLQAAFARPGGEELRRWIDDCPNSLYSALTFQGGAAWRQAVLADCGRSSAV
ncbi:MAG: transketolase, partial [Acetobacteraceae bacterium]|nr:transketolase [Acetobacteraceae bacterium]